jgi:histidinol-phosphatase
MVSQRALLAAVEREVIRCRPLALRYFRSAALRVERKPDRSPVTVADRAIEERLRRAIRRIAPGESVLGEEFGYRGRAGPTYWTVDPIDGTRAFSRGLPSWGIMVGRVEQGRPLLGVCDFPAIAVTIGAAPGVAAYERTRAGIRRVGPPRRVRSLGEAVIFHGGARWWRRTRFAAGFDRLTRACYLERAYGDCYGYLWALRGCADAVVDYGVKAWDMAPLAALAGATGRVLTDFQGRPSWAGPQAVFASPQLGPTICRVLSGRAPR